MHNNTDSTYFSHFWSNIKTNDKTNVHLPCSAKKSSAHSDAAALNAPKLTRIRRHNTHAVTDKKKILPKLVTQYYITHKNKSAH